MIPVTVGCFYYNEPCVSVTVCSPGTNNCQTIPNILVDTGSYGLRIFKSLVSIPLTQEKDSSGQSIVECAGYLQGVSNLGYVQVADLVVGKEKASSVPIQLIADVDCDGYSSDPQSAGYNGILGVGLLTEDCGSACADNTENGQYFSCGSYECNYAAVPLQQQVSNPVTFLPSDNNGVILQLPAIPAAGAQSVTGYLILGIGTQADNTPNGAVNVFPVDIVDDSPTFNTQFNGVNYTTAFLDSGSNGLFFPAPGSIIICDANGQNDPGDPLGEAAGLLCPSSTVNLTAVQMGANDSPKNTISFQIMNGETALVDSGNSAFNDIGGVLPEGFDGFDWGLPFFFGRTIFVGISGKSSSVGGVGPYWAY